MDNIKNLIQKKGIDRFKGFSKPSYTQCPDEIFDRFLTELTHSELKVLLYIVRRTFGFKKESDKVSLKQISGGITTQGGNVLDRGAGVDRSTTIRAVKSLEKKGLITVSRIMSEDGYNQINTYSLRFQGE